MVVSVVVGGQLPPPLSGQHIAVRRLLDELQRDPRVEVAHVVYRFAGSMGDQGRPSIRKLVEIVRIWGRLLRTRSRGPIDVFVHPIGGPSRSSTIRDLLILPLALLVSRRVVLQFHGAGHGRLWPGDRSLVVRLARPVLGRCHGAVVHAEANRVDPAFLGIARVVVVPHRLEDRFRDDLVARDDVHTRTRLLYVGHLGPQRGTPQLLAAVASVAAEFPGVTLTLAGEPVGAYTHEQLQADIHRAGGAARVHHAGPIDGHAKAAAFATAHVFVFPSVFEAESFGLVLAEALMWGLPVVATDWRANAEVVGPGADAVIHPVGPELGVQVASGIRTMLGRLRDGRCPTWSATNRARYVERFRASDAASPLCEAILDLAPPARRPS